MTDKRIVLITGATGNQGGAVARHLTGKGFRIRAMTRKVDSDAARSLAETGAEIVKGDLDDEASIEAALSGAWGAFAVQNTWEAGVLGEEEQGKRFAAAARRVGIQHFVYSSVGSAHRRTGVPHFENKWRIEQTVRGLGFPSWVIIRPVFFMENLTSPWFLSGDKLGAAMEPNTVLQMIAVDDIGKHGARAFTDASALNGREIDLAGDALTMPQAAKILSGGLGRPIEFMRVPIEEVRKNSEDMALMLEWFDRVGYDADIEGLERESGIKPTKLKEWTERQRG